MSAQRWQHWRGTLVRVGVSDAPRAFHLLDELEDWAGSEERSLITQLSEAADPDRALLGLVRLREVLSVKEREEVSALLADPQSGRRDRLIRLLGASSALADHLVLHHDQWRDVAAATIRSREELVAALAGEVGDETGPQAYDALRVAYRRQLVQIATVDLMNDAVEVFPQVSGALADLAGAALEAALGIAQREVEGSEQCRLTIIGMGKCGGHELNYISDVDVIFVAEPADGADEDEALAIGARVATAAMHACTDPTTEGSLWQVDAALRPEGKNGPLVRTVASHRAYYERWAKTWEFQALLKARPVAGDVELGATYLDCVRPMVWEASKREKFVEDVQAMRRRVEDNVPPDEAPRQLKLGHGGLRDIEFSVQLLQLVHGRTDESIRDRGTLAAIESLSRGGYIGRVDAHELDGAYRVLRVLEHRIQMSRMRRTHLMPTSSAELRRLGRAMGHRSAPADAVVTQWREQAREVRRLHERLFYRPLLSAVARLSDDDARMSLESAQDRLQALGFRDPRGAIRHIEALTTGVSRRASIQRTLMPVMLQWFAHEADPDLGLLAFRRISDALGSTHWYLKMLRDEGSAAETLAKVLASSRYVGEMLERTPSAVSLFGSTKNLEPLSREQILTAMQAAVDRQSDDDDEAVLAVRSNRRTELIRIAIADLAGVLVLEQVEDAIVDLTSATLQAILDIAIRHVEREHGRALQTRIAIIGMGRLGGGEMGYASDADVLFVHDPLDDADIEVAKTQAGQVVSYLRTRLSGSGPGPAIEVDAGLRPEGKAGPIARTLDSYAAYYARWSEGWEAQALLRATPVAGDPDLGAAFIELINPLRWPADGISEAALRQIRTLKARMEAERIPRGGDVRSHFKLGRGGLSDVEWTVQLCQLQHAGETAELRRTGTISTLQVMTEHDLLTSEEALQLRESWCLASRLRNASVLWRGRPVDALPSSLTDSDAIARILGWPAASGYELHEHYLRVARKARAVTEMRFYGTDLSEMRDSHPSTR
ncbi:bifunctional [glutamine synthetase] adenylyltransferase/[glutamine synthetase]-adenylyl-L-tyrosine phosphorylase [Leekyejoonella antrihumi]|uniref:Bifunctional glutamine synthetase adenylyltransferase/adenylyl-removing enzyme n=1 Tax=Leekyejoonella antrihumi TaxID=1660198 RepID=A0A563DRQ6_9MICO|nr:bifunctional [glutamine synthetase] adenylyltransferase/[glutamine synthetase]-adenylyl-L-tyrosine phosphorylase [Leekyejoonella antrihumi]TWP32937.1 bifunctional [glutamine synthetase] adenylyltransferase/[glutamine synthetase]-adenylyl-L-tyrosine phosphorylase [Leekyejoonella antrihumi]